MTAQQQPGDKSQKFGPWNPGLTSSIPPRLLPLSTMFRPENVAVEHLKPIGYKIALEIMLVGSFKNVVEVPFIFVERSAGQSKLRPQQQIDYLKHIFIVPCERSHVCA